MLLESCFVVLKCIKFDIREVLAAVWWHSKHVHPINFQLIPTKHLFPKKNHSQNDLFLGKFVSLSIFSHFSFFIFQFEMRKHTQTFCDPIAMQLKLFFHTSSNNHLLISAGDEIFNHSQSLSLVF